MKKFDRASIYARAVTRLNNNDKWRAVTNDSVISALIKTNAEMNAETARYMEYLFRESKWDDAQNPSSIQAQASMLGYRPRRATCASGKVRFSGEVTTTQGTDSTGMDFYAPSVGDDGVAIIYQGVLQTKTISYSNIMSSYTESKLDPYIYIPVMLEDCDDASTSATRNFFRVESSTDGTNWKEWKVASTTLFNDNTDGYIEVYNDPYSFTNTWMKFNNDPNRGACLPLYDNNLRIRIQYLKTLGAKGNISVIGKEFKFGNTLGVNTEPISGGQDAETIEDIKRSAPRYYLKSYTTGTKEAYQEAIKNIGFTFGEGTSVSYPTNVIVWGSKEKDTSGSQVPVTCVSFVAPNLEDWASNLDINNPNPFESIDKQMRDYLNDLKAPQDILKFVMPNYVPFALNTKVRVSGDNTMDVISLKKSARNAISSLWGSNSDKIDFGRNFYPTEVVTNISGMSPDVKSVEVTMEALSRVEWQNARRILPNSESIIHTIRVPFDFDKIFRGNGDQHGMQGLDKESGYAMRIDFMYKRPESYANGTDYSVSIFVPRTREVVGNPSNKAFYVMKDNGSTSTTSAQGLSHIWVNANMSDSDYSMVKDNVYRITDAYQYYFRNESYTDTDYTNLISELNPVTEGIGTMPSYMVYYSDENEVNASGRIENGSFIELSFDGLWEILAGYGLMDECPLDALKCSSGTESDNAFREFVSILDQYVECVVSMKPVDVGGLVISSMNEDGVDSTVLYIDDSDSEQTGITNISSLKSTRMNTVNIGNI